MLRRTSVEAHPAASRDKHVEVPLSLSPQGWPSRTPRQTHRGGHLPLLLMSFLRRLALKSFMTAKKESVAKCAGPLQYGVGRPDGADTMIKTVQYFAEAGSSRVLVALDLKDAFQNVSRGAMLFSIE